MTVRRGDLLGPVPGVLDVVVANLPYLPLVRAGLDADLEREPAEAVFAPGDGLDHYRRLVAASRERLAPGGGLAASGQPVYFALGVGVAGPNGVLAHNNHTGVLGDGKGTDHLEDSGIFAALNAAAASCDISTG